MKVMSLKSFVVEQLEALKAHDIVAVDIRSQTTVADYFIIASGLSKRHCQALATRVIEASKLNDIKVLGCEGHTFAEWILIDFGDVVLHIMQREARTRYDLEGLWQNASICAQIRHGAH